MPKLVNAVGGLSRLLPNVRGADFPCQLFYAGVLRYMVLYGASVWAYSSQNSIRYTYNQLESTVRYSGRRQSSWQAICLVSYRWKCLPDFMQSAQASSREGYHHRAMILQWRGDFGSPAAGLATVKAARRYPERWVNREFGVSIFRLVNTCIRFHVRRHLICHECDASIDSAHQTHIGLTTP